MVPISDERGKTVDELTEYSTGNTTQTVNQSASVNENSAKMEQITRNIEKFNELVLILNENVTELSSDIEQIKQTSTV